MSKNTMNEIREWIVSIAIAAAVTFTIKYFVFDIIQVSGTSMVPTLHNNDRVTVEKISLKMNKLTRGEIVIFDPGDKGRGIYIKRIIGLPGDDVEIKEGLVYVNGESIKEDYLKPGTYTDSDMKLTVPDNEIFVLGDNREVSEDSRYIGPVPIENLKGHAVFRLFPFNQMGSLK
jgi:signal peptidase I